MKKSFCFSAALFFLLIVPVWGQDVGTVVQKGFTRPSRDEIQSFFLQQIPLEFSFPSDAYARHLLGDGRVDFLSRNMLSECVGLESFSNKIPLLLNRCIFPFRLRRAGPTAASILIGKPGSSITWYFSPSQL